MLALYHEFQYTKISMSTIRPFFQRSGLVPASLMLVGNGLSCSLRMC